MIAWSFPQIDLSAPIVLPQIQLIRGRSDHQSELQSSFDDDTRNLQNPSKESSKVDHDLSLLL